MFENLKNKFKNKKSAIKDMIAKGKKAPAKKSYPYPITKTPDGKTTHDMRGAFEQILKDKKRI